MSSLTEREIMFCKRQYDAMDAEAKGYIMRDQIGDFFMKIGVHMPPDVLMTVASMADVNNDGRISWAELQTVGLQQVPHEEYVKARCRLAYMKTGPPDPEWIAQEQLLHILTEARVQMPPPQVAAIFDSMDKDPMGRVRMEDFLLRLKL